VDLDLRGIGVLGAILVGVDIGVLRAVQASLRSLGSPWRVPPLSAASNPPIPVTTAHWQIVLEDSGLAALLLNTRKCVAQLNAVLEAGPRSVGKRLRSTVVHLVEVVRDLNATTSDVLAFEPPDRERPDTLRDLVSSISTDICQSLDDLAAGRDPADGKLLDEISRAADFIGDQLDESVDDNDPVARVYGFSHEELTSRTLPVGQDLRAAFAGRRDELGRITARIIGFANRGQPMVEQLDGALHPFALATDKHLLVAHRAARDACDLVRDGAARNPAGTAAVIVSMLGLEQAMYSTHRAISQTRRVIQAATDEDERTRAVAELYRASAEGPLRMAATELLGLLGEGELTIAGLNLIKTRLLARKCSVVLWKGMAWTRPAVAVG
jgi:hypothetical protein